MDIYRRFNQQRIDDRKIDTLIGISKGLIADGKINQPEAEFFLKWLKQSQQTTQDPVILNLLKFVIIS